MPNKNKPFPWGIYIGDLIDNNDTIPLCLDSKQGGFCVLFDEDSELIANNFIENIALKLFEVLPIGDIVVDIFDFSHKKRFMHLSSLQNHKLYDIAFNQNSATNKFNKIEEIALNPHHSILTSATPTISDYNQESKFKEQYHLLLINLDSFPDEMTSAKRIKNFFTFSIFRTSKKFRARRLLGQLTSLCNKQMTARMTSVKFGMFYKFMRTSC